MITVGNIFPMGKSRLEAKANGEIYYQGQACANGGPGMRRVSDRHCVCDVCGDKKTDSSRTRKKKSYISNVKKHAKLNKAWEEKNRHIRAKIRSNRRARQFNATANWFGEWDDFVLTEAADLRFRREAATGLPWHVDHMIPLQARTACGLHCAENFQVIPALMNTVKKNKMQFTAPGEWVRFA